MSVRVRAACSDDLAAVLALLRELHSEDPAVPLPHACAVWDAILAQPGRTVLVAENDSGHIVGTAEITITENLTRGARPFGLVENVVVEESQRRLGAGRALLDRATELARAASAYKVQLASGSADATSFYQAVGWSVAGETMKRYLAGSALTDAGKAPADTAP
ncbi:GNAT family N-acetyltransferase [Cellulomonas sp. KRMCY2]|uniref:GNAT family N-acetyltransferase n=1 Tax=Cellulomonas sp. KRMCY2 TaxID=1304865 RepID=UPI00045E5F34|nr:GNAT family N-acetyltransferase [Cellulomonas sp. KRMCY2]